MSKLTFFKPSVPAKEQILFVRNLSLLSKSGLPLLSSLKLIQKQTTSRGLKKVLTQLSIDVENGQFLAMSLKKFEYTFGPLFVNVVKIGEASGTLVDNLEFLATELKKKQLLRGKIMSAMMYPLIIILATTALVGLLTFVIFPKILPIFANLNITLPVATRILIAFHGFATAHWLSSLLVLIVGGIGVSFALRVAPIRALFDRALLSVPVLGSLIQSIQVAIISRTLALLLKSGVKIVEALTITAGVTTNVTFERILTEAAQQVTMGEPLGVYLQKYPKVFPGMFSQMLEVGETAGTLDTTLAYLSDYYESEVDEVTRNLVSLLEPLLMIVMGGIVAFMAMAILLPIYSISQTIAA